MALEDNENLPLLGLGQKLVGSYKSEVSRVGDDLVIKADRSIYEEVACSQGESDEEYKQRRLEASLGRIREELQYEREAKEVLPQEIVAPTEYHFIGNGDDGFPIPFRVQRLVEGKMFREVADEDLGEEQRRDVDLLVEASFRCNRKYGRHLDLVGLIEGDKISKVATFFRLFNPLKHSANIFLTRDGRIAIVDVKSTPRGQKPVYKQIKDGVLFMRFFWNRLKNRAERDLRLEKRQSIRETQKNF